MNYHRVQSDESAPPYNLEKKSRVNTTLGMLVCLVIGVVGATTWFNTRDHKAETMANDVANHTAQISTLQTTVSTLQGAVDRISIKQDSQSELLRYIARDRRGPVPDSIKQSP